MFEDRREQFQVVDLSGKEPATKISFNLSTLQFIVWSVSKIAGVVIAMFFFAQWVAGLTFNQELELFHEKVRPSISEEIEDGQKAIRVEMLGALKVHELEAQQKYLQDLSEIKGAIIKIQTDIEHIKENGHADN